MWVFETDNTVNCGLVGLQIGTVLLVRFSVSVWNWHYGKRWAEVVQIVTVVLVWNSVSLWYWDYDENWAGFCADYYSNIGEIYEESVELTVRLILDWWGCRWLHCYWWGLMWVCGINSTVNSGLVGMRIVSVLLVWFSVSVWYWHYGKHLAGSIADCISVIVVG
jgi:hypothetical protein